MPLLTLELSLLMLIPQSWGPQEPLLLLVPLSQMSWLVLRSTPLVQMLSLPVLIPQFWGLQEPSLVLIPLPQMSWVALGSIGTDIVPADAGAWGGGVCGGDACGGGACL